MAQTILTWNETPGKFNKTSHEVVNTQLVLNLYIHAHSCARKMHNSSTIHGTISEPLFHFRLQDG